MDWAEARAIKQFCSSCHLSSTVLQLLNQTIIVRCERVNTLARLCLRRITPLEHVYFDDILSSLSVLSSGHVEEVSQMAAASSLLL